MYGNKAVQSNHKEEEENKQQQQNSMRRLFPVLYRLFRIPASRQPGTVLRDSTSFPSREDGERGERAKKLSVHVKTIARGSAHPRTLRLSASHSAVIGGPLRRHPGSSESVAQVVDEFSSVTEPRRGVYVLIELGRGMK